MNRPTIEYPNPIPIYPANTDTAIIVPTIPLDSDDKCEPAPVTRTARFYRYPELPRSHYTTVLNMDMPPIRMRYAPRYPARLGTSGKLWRTLAIVQSIALVGFFLLLLAMS